MVKVARRQTMSRERGQVPGESALTRATVVHVRGVARLEPDTDQGVISLELTTKSIEAFYVAHARNGFVYTELRVSLS
jgi:hypothetical protein